MAAEVLSWADVNIFLGVLSPELSLELGQGIHRHLLLGS